MTGAASGARIVVIDTDVWSRLALPKARAHPLAAAWKSELLGATVVIAAQTRAEVLAGLLIRNWGGKRAAAARAVLDGTPTIPVDGSVIDAYAQLQADCRAMGHALHEKIHTADRWVAATALAHGWELLAGDGIYKQAPGLRVIDID